MEGDQKVNSTSPAPEPEMMIEEWNGTSSTKLTKTATITSTSHSSISIQRSSNAFTHISQRILQAFVPEGYPTSVTPDYFPFQVWDSLQGLSTYVRMMLSTQGSNLDSNAKMWRLVADLMNDLGMLMDLVSPLFPSAFVFIVCLGSLSRSFTGVASGATRAALTQHFALENNAADIAAKEGSQETLATMIGMALGMLLARLTIGHSFAIWISFLSLTMFHMYANYKAVCCLSLNTLNCERCSIVLSHFVKTGQVLSPKHVSSMEHVLPLWMTSWNLKGGDSLYKQVRLGVRVSSLDSLAMVDLLQSAGSHYKKEKYLLQQKGGIIRIITHKDSAGADILQSFIHALVMAKLDDQDGSMSSESQSWMDKHYEVFVLKLQSSGWKTERLLSSSVVWRANWLVDYSDGKHD